MIVNIDTSYLKKIPSLTLGQLVFLNLVYDKSNKSQSSASFIRLISDKDIQDLIDKDLVSMEEKDTNKLYEVTDNFKQIVGDVEDPFKEFYNLYPALVLRPDGTKGYLRTNTNKCNMIYRHLVGNSAAMHHHLMECLQHEIDDKMMTNKMGYMKTMYRWLTNHEWEVAEEQMRDDIAEPETKETYGTELI